MKAKIYTKKGDDGTTGTINKGRIHKSDQLAQALGAIDELNSWIGVCRSEILNMDMDLKRIQTNLLTIGSGLAGSQMKLKAGEIRQLEKLIDKLTEDLPELKNFIYPIGNLQMARAVARRAEREVVRLTDTDNANVLKYLNRLSDALFVMARWVNFKNGVKEEIWKNKL